MMIVYDIKWDTDGEEINLPTEVDFAEEIEEDMIADTLSDIYGWCVESFEVCYDPLPF